MVHRAGPEVQDADASASMPRTPPTGPGWIIQIACHHYNPYPDLRDPRSQHLCPRVTTARRTDFGPVQFLTDKVLPKLNDPRLRLFGVTHVAVAG